MNEDLPDFLPVPSSPSTSLELRARVLAAVERELKQRRKPRWERALEWSVAASLLLGVGLNAWNTLVEPERFRGGEGVVGRTAGRGEAADPNGRPGSTDQIAGSRRFDPDAQVSWREYNRLLQELAELSERKL